MTCTVWTCPRRQAMYTRNDRSEQHVSYGGRLVIPGAFGAGAMQAAKALGWHGQAY